MIAAVIERDLDIDQLVTSQDAAFHCLLHTLLNRLKEFPRHGTALDLIDELKALAHLIGINAQLHMPVVARTAGLANVFALRLSMLADGFTVCHLGLTHVGFHFVLAHHSVYDDFQVKLTHAADDGLTRIRVCRDFKRGVFLGQAVQRHAHLFLVALGLWLNRHRNHGGREFNGLQQDRGLV